MVRNNRSLAIYLALSAAVIAAAIIAVAHSPAANASPDFSKPVVQQLVDQATARMSSAASTVGVRLTWQNVSDINSHIDEPSEDDPIMISMSEMNGLYRQSPFAIFYRCACS